MSVQESCNSVKFCYKYVMDKHFLIWLTYFMIHICNIHELQICKNIMSQGRTQDIELGGGASGVSTISARGVLKVRPHTKSGGGGGAIRFRSDTFGHTENIYMYLPTCYLGILHTRARMNVKYMPAIIIIFLSSIC